MPNRPPVLPLAGSDGNRSASQKGKARGGHDRVGWPLESWEGYPAFQEPRESPRPGERGRALSPVLGLGAISSSHLAATLRPR